MSGVYAVYPGSTASLGPARFDLDRWLSGQNLGSDFSGRATLVLSELATNAIQASPHQDFAVRLDRPAPHSITITVTNQVNPQTVDTDPLVAAVGGGAMPDVAATHGWGLPIVAVLCDRVEIETVNGWVTVTGHLITPP